MMTYKLFAVLISITFLSSCQKNASENSAAPVTVGTSSLSFGSWGGNGVQMTTALTGGTVRFSCAVGTFGSPIADGRNAWHANGTFLEVTGAEPAEVEKNSAIPVLFTVAPKLKSKLANTVMLSITTIPAGDGSTHLIGEWELMFGSTGRMVFCQ